jgi:hypothetical protein
MTLTRQKWLVGTTGIGVLAVVLVLGGLLVKSRRPLNGPGPIHSAPEEGWARLRIGMTRDEVIALLGRSESECGPVMTDMEPNPAVVVSPEFWEYSWTDGLPAQSPSDKAYVVEFDLQGRLSAFRKPKDGSAR